MIISDEKALERLGSVDNLMNRLKNLNHQPRGISLFVPANKQTEEVNIVPMDSEDSNKNNPSIDDLINNVDQRLQIATAHDNAVALMDTAIKELTLRLPEIKADKLPSVITAASRMVTDIRREKLESDKVNANRNVHHHFYIPEQRKIEHYDVIDVG